MEAEGLTSLLVVGISPGMDLESAWIFDYKLGGGTVLRPKDAEKHLKMPRSQCTLLAATDIGD